MTTTIRGGDNWSTQGVMVQAVHYQTGALATGTTLIPSDDTIPQNTEGTEFMTLAITPKSATNKLLIDVTFIGSYSGATNLVAALFQDSTANALAAGWFVSGAASENITIRFQHEMTAGTTSPTTFKVRAGGNGAGTVTFNGQAGAARYGGVLASSIRITEITQ
jgi:hypothetical protein